MGYVPVIDLAPAAAGWPPSKPRRRSPAPASMSGFFAIFEHDVPAAVVDGAWNAARRFFDLPDEESAGRSCRGQAILMAGRRWLAKACPIPWAITGRPISRRPSPIGPADITPAPSISDAVDFAWAANIWPAAPAGFRDALLAYYRASDLADRLMDLFALGLGLPEQFFAPTIDQAISALRLLNYPNQNQVPSPANCAPAHTPIMAR